MLVLSPSFWMISCSSWTQVILHAFLLPDFLGRMSSAGFALVKAKIPLKVYLDIPSCFLVSLRGTLDLNSAMAALFMSFWRVF
jgi:hypothetical protein